MNIIIKRKAASYSYKANGPASADDWHNNDHNNSLDTIELWDAGALLHATRVQTVANMPGARFKDTIKPGPFGIKLFVEPRAFRGRIHGIVNTTDFDGQVIDGRSIQPIAGKDGGPINVERWLFHDTQKHAPAPAGEVTRVAWSAGCFIVAPVDLEIFGNLFTSHGLKAGDIVSGDLVEIE